MKVPFLSLDRQYRRYRKDFLEIADCVWSTGRVLQGSQVGELEEQVAGLCGRKYGVAVGSCTDALAFAFIAHGIWPGDEVLITSYSFFASLSPVIRIGATPRFVDIDPDYYMMDLNRLEELVSPRTRTVVAVHLFGQTLPMDRLESFAREHGLVLIEDAAQALGSRDGERPGGSLGHTSCLSFDPTKNVGSFGSAGMLLTDDEQIAQTVRQLRYHGRDPVTGQYKRLGYNSQLSSAMADILSFKLSLFETWNQEREQIAGIYCEGLGGVVEVELPKIRPGSNHTWHKFVIRARDRDGLAQWLKEHGVATMVHYRQPLCDEPFVQEKFGEAKVPMARQATREVISLPIYPELTSEEAKYVVDGVKSFYVRGTG